MSKIFQNFDLLVGPASMIWNFLYIPFHIIRDVKKEVVYVEMVLLSYSVVFVVFEALAVLFLILSCLIVCCLELHGVVLISFYGIMSSYSSLF